MIEQNIMRLVEYAVENQLIEREDIVWARNCIAAALNVSTPEFSCEINGEINLEAILASILDYAQENEIIESGTASRDLFDTKLMGLLTPRPSDIIKKFNEKYAVSPQSATEYYYELSRCSDYIRTYRIKKDIKWIYSHPEYGDIEITINLSKPEKDPKAIAAAKTAAQSGYPKCQLCRESEGYAGRMDFPARENHRIIPVTLEEKQWYMQYSPYVYYNEHCIVLNSEHVPMSISSDTFKRLLGFVEQFPHYFVGSNADLPIVGGSILTHEHFQGGHHDFAMAKSPIEAPFTFAGFEDVSAGIVKWPMSCIRLSSDNASRLSELASKILTSWRGYTDEAAFIFAETDGEAHNTITPIARKKNGLFELDLVLRNNITTAEYPDGLYHPHPELFHIKKENIGLIEVMGLAVLPPRLRTELSALKQSLLSGTDLRGDALTEKHADWAEAFIGNYDNISSETIDNIINSEVGKVFCTVLEHAGVYKRTEDGRQAFLRFLSQV